MKKNGWALDDRPIEDEPYKLVTGLEDANPPGVDPPGKQKKQKKQK